MTRSMVNQKLYLGLEASPGVAQTANTKRVLGLRGRPVFTDEGEDFTAAGSKVPTARIQNNEMGGLTVEAIQDFNAFTWLLTGGFGKPASTLVATATKATDHVFTLNPFAADLLATFTAIWGDATQAVQMLQTVFQSLQIGIQRGGSLSLSSAAIGREPTFGATIPASGVTEIPAQPIGARLWDIYADDDYASIGTTKLLAAYEGSVNFGDKYTPDYVINSAVPSYDSLLEAESATRDGNLRVGFDATAVALSTTFKAGAVKFLRFAASGPEIEPGFNYEAEIDLAVRITGRGELSSAPNSPAVSLPFTFGLTVAEGFSASARVRNAVTAL